MKTIAQMIFELFKDKEVEMFLDGLGSESIWLDQFSIDNRYTLHVRVIDYSADHDVLIVHDHAGDTIYLKGESITAFWEPGTRVVESIGRLIPTGKNLKKSHK